MRARSSVSASLLASLMVLEGGLDLFRLAVDEVQGDAGLHVDEGHVMGHDVVQLTGDAQAFLAGLAPPLLGPGPPELDHPGPVQPDELAGGQHQQAPRQHAGERRPRPALVEDGQPGDEGQGDGTRHRAPGLAPVASGDVGERRAHERREDRPVRVAEGDVEEGDRRDEDQHAARALPEQVEARRAGDRDEDGERVRLAGLRLPPGCAERADDLHEGQQDRPEEPEAPWRPVEHRTAAERRSTERELAGRGRHVTTVGERSLSASSPGCGRSAYSCRRTWRGRLGPWRTTLGRSTSSTSTPI